MTLLLWLASPAAAGEEAAAILSAQISLADWGIADPASIRWGRLSVVAEPAGERLDVLLLRPAAPRAAEPEIRAAAPEIGGGGFTLIDFSEGNTNRLGGYFNVFARAPSSAAFDVDRRPHGRRTLQLSYHRAAAGFAGLWMHFYDFLDAGGPRTLLDARELGYLTLWVRGREGSEELVLKLADARLDRLDDALAVGPLEFFLPAGRLGVAWQRAVVPLDRLPAALDRGQLASLVLEAAAGLGAVEIAQVAFSRGPDELPELPEAVPVSAAPEPSRALWVWNTAELLRDAAARAALLTFLERQGFAVVYLQLPGETGVPARLEAGDAAALRNLVGALQGLGLSVRALDGHASFVLPEKRRQVLDTVRDVAAYNAAAAPGERFSGVHYDVEPYLLPGFGGPRREEYLTDFVQLVARVASLARRHGLLVGVDLPFWYDMPDEVDGELLTVEHKGRRRVVTEHVIDLVDAVTLMDYRTAAYGPDGVLFHAAGELAYADRAGKRVYVGLETGVLPDETYVTFAGEAQRGLPRDEAGPRVVLVARGTAATVYLVGPEPLAGRLRVEEGATVLSWPVTGRVPIPASKLTFAELGGGALAAVLRQVGHELRGRPSFAGFALHHYESLRALRAAAERP